MSVARHRMTSTRPTLLSVLVRTVACAGVAAALMPSWPARPAAQEGPSTAEREAAAAWLAARPPEPAFVCGTPELVARQTWLGVTRLPVIRMADEEMEESPYGQPLWFDPQPRLIRADNTEGLTFNDVLIVGDIETVEFERWSSAAGEAVTEIWTRTGTRSFSGLVSAFNPTWDETELWDTIGRRRRGFDSPFVYFGTLKVPKLVETDDETMGDDEPEEDAFERVAIHLPVAPLNLPASRVEKIGDSMQYASHVVNMVVPGFGNERADGDDYAFELQEVTKEFYEFFPDVYDSIAIATAEQHPSSKFGAYHWNARNPIRGLGRDEFDYTDFFGSRGALRSVEFYRDARFTAVWTSNHEIGHQWADYWDWTEITDGIEGKGWSPAAHTPLLFPGEVLLGSVLRPIRRVALADGGDEGEGASYVIERTPAPSVYHPTILYRMGLIGCTT